MVSNKAGIADKSEEIKCLLSKAKEAIPPEIKVSQEAYPGTVIQIGRFESILHGKTNGVLKLSTVF